MPSMAMALRITILRPSGCEFLVGQSVGQFKILIILNKMRLSPPRGIALVSDFNDLA